MSSTGTKNALNMEALALLKHSKTVQTWPWLHDFLNSKEKIKEKDIEHLPQEQREFLERMLPEITEKAAKEWRRIVGRCIIAGKDVTCSLCGQHNTYIYYIENLHTKKELNVGSTCIDTFGIERIKGNLSKAEEKRQARRLYCLGQLKEHFKDIDIKGIVQEWMREPARYPLLIPNYLEMPYVELGQAARELYESYLEQSLSYGTDTIAELEEVLAQSEQMINAFRDYSNKHIHDEYIVTRQMADSIWGPNSDIAIRKLKKTGKVDYETIQYIEDAEFMETLIPKFNGVLTGLGIKVEKVDKMDGRLGYVVKLLENKVHLFSINSSFASAYGCLLFGIEPSNPHNLREFMRISRVYENDSGRSMKLAADNLKAILAKTDIKIVYHDLNANEIEFHNARMGTYLQQPLKPFVNGFKRFVFGYTKDGTRVILNHLNSLSGWFSKEDRAAIRDAFRGPQNTRKRKP